MDISYRPTPQNVSNTYQTFTDAVMAGAQWDYQSGGGECEAGKFTTNSDITAETVWIRISSTNTAGTNSSYILLVGVGNFIRFTNTTGHTVVFTIASMTQDGDDDCAIVGVVFEGGDTPWAGRYVCDFQPGTQA